MTVARLGRPDMGHLRFLVVGDHPDVGQRHQRQNLGSDAEVLAGLDETLADHAVDRRDDPGVAEIDLREVARRRLRRSVAFACRSWLSSTLSCWRCCSSCARLSASVASLCAALSTACSVNCCVPAILVAEQRLLTLRLQPIANHVRFGGPDRRLGLIDQRLAAEPSAGRWFRACARAPATLASACATCAR